jgi:hypothetical protein
VVAAGYIQLVGRGRILLVVRAASVAIVLVAIVAQAVTLANAIVFGPTRFFAFFTIESNLIGVAAFALLVANRGRPRSRGLERLRGAAAVYLTITFFVVIFLLSGVDVQLQLGWVDFVLHKLFPVIVVLDWVVDPPTARLTARDAFVWLVYPIVWTVLTVSRGAVDGWYPYPFLNPANGGYGQVAVTVLAVVVGFLVFAAVTVAIGNATGRAVRERQPAG